MFSWGGLEVRSEPLQAAMAAATERMQETRRGRKPGPEFPTQIEEATRQAV